MINIIISSIIIIVNSLLIVYGLYNLYNGDYSKLIINSIDNVINEYESLWWENISKKYNYMAMDGNGDVYVYIKQPVENKNEGEWNYTGNNYKKIFHIYESNKINWLETLRERPREEVEKL